MANNTNWDKWCPTWRILLLYTHLSALCDLLIYAFYYNFAIVKNNFHGLGIFFFGYMMYLTPYFCLNYKVLVERKIVSNSKSSFWKGFWPFLFYDSVLIYLAIATIKKFLVFLKVLD